MTQKAKLKTPADSPVLLGLNERQAEAVTHGEGPQLIVAGAGTGKTTVITRRIAYLIEKGVKPESILALTFAEKAAEEMSERVDQLLPFGYYNLQISTFHSFGERLLHDYGLEIGLPNFKVLDEVGQWLLIRNNLELLNLRYYKPLGAPTRFIRALVSHFSRLKDELITPQNYLDYGESLMLGFDKAESGGGRAAEGQDPEEAGRILEIGSTYHLYQRILLEKGFLDFGDLINYSLELLQSRPKLLSILRDRFQYILIDEFQDTNFSQYQLIRLLSSPKNNITVVGDDDQSIFKFRGASISNILHFQKDFPDAKFISLTDNYRSGQKILDESYRFIRQNDPDRLETRLKIQKKLTSHVDSPGVIEAVQLPDFTLEARFVTEKIASEKELAERSWNDFAILARSHDALEPFIASLEAAGIPYIYFANKGLYRKPVILDLLAYFRLLDNYHESQALYRVLNFPIFSISANAVIELSHFARRKSLSLFESLRQAATVKGVGAGDVQKINKLLAMLEKHCEEAKSGTAGEVLIKIMLDLDFEKRAMADSVEGYRDAKDLEAFRNKIINFQQDSADKSFRNFVEQLRFEQEAGEEGKMEVDPEAGPEAVKLLTVHGAKGLEFPIVFVVGLIDKRFPTIERRDPIEIPTPLVKDILPEGDFHLQEERRLFYVGMTRAREKLYFTRALNYGGKLTRKPSRFLIELGLAESQIARPTGRVEIQRKNPHIQLPLPKVFSFSQISTFRKCPLEYKYRHVLRLPEIGSGQLSFGQTIHKTLENYLRLYKQKMQSRDLFGTVAIEPPGLEELRRQYENCWVDEWYESKQQKEEYRQLGLRILRDIEEETRKNRPSPKLLEEKFKLKIQNGWIAGKIDRADDTPDGLLIIDYKTGEARGVNKVDKEQLLLYQWAAEEFFKEKVARLEYWFLHKGLEKKEFLGSEKDLIKLRMEFDQAAAEIIECTKNDSFYETDLKISHDCKYRHLEK